MASSVTFAVLEDATFNRFHKTGLRILGRITTSRPSRRPVWMRYVVLAEGGVTSRHTDPEALAALCTRECTVPADTRARDRSRGAWVRTGGQGAEAAAITTASREERCGALPVRESTSGGRDVWIRDGGWGGVRFCVGRMGECWVGTGYGEFVKLAAALIATELLPWPIGPHVRG